MTMSRPSLEPPGHTEKVHAQSVLVLAPHYDDEVIGCGGLIVQLAGEGARVVVLFLTDGGGGVEGAPSGSAAADRARYSAERRAEAAQAAATLGVERIEHLGHADGELASSRGELAERYRSALCELRPDLLLVPSPLEVTADHRAAFAALHDLLSPLRGGTDLDAVARHLLVLAYEVNHPGYPDLLVDVGQEMETVARALRCYQSQLARHDYLEAALGLRRYRTYTLGPGVRGAEGYSRLTSADFITRSRAKLIADLGGVADRLTVEPAIPISVVVRTKDRPELLAEALASLAATGYPNLEVVVVNDGGAEPTLPDDPPFRLVHVDLECNRGRAAAANVGIARATAPWISFLDDDDLVYPEHFATLAAAAAGAGVRVVYADAAVGVYRLAETAKPATGGWIEVERRLPYSRDFDSDLLLLDNYIPFHTVLVERELLSEVGELDESLPMFEDWDLLIRLSRRSAFHHLRTVTCEYRHFLGSGHHALGARTEDAGTAGWKAKVIAKHASSVPADRLAGVVSRLRREAVARGEEVSQVERALAAERASHREHLARLREDVERLQRERDHKGQEVVAQSLERERLAQRGFDLEEEGARVREENQRLNGEVVALQEERQSWLRQEAVRDRVEADNHRLHGEAVGLREERDRWLRDHAATAVEVQRLYDQEVQLRAAATDLRAALDAERGSSSALHSSTGELARALEEHRQRSVIQGAAIEQQQQALGQQAEGLRRQDEALQQTYSEIERLNRLIGSMEGSRAWRLHRFVERLRGRSG